ncbi:pimeloyl-ACP methyl ester carboxylesterase [Propionibacteriaceae bacterium ES.041]|uniref:alpha/beta fold hydrolase n=1 Tax=Enemella evansiae TaxID=2016499 RepID=UPI000B9645AD|nr:alpha/beta hydrolase [Enemella evansiae]OYO07365.1 alpha/beta hydrolase [Enemella evansiae]PFG67413.1 pimeloyl-ACP methyl ester carboxylesterase [Propionibacteriaceae bacterium ES.041]
MESRMIMRDGVRLHGLWRAGEGPPVVVIPGVMADAESFGPVVDAIEGGRPVLIVNRRGRAPSGPLGKGYAVAVEVADLRAWLDELGRPVSLVGWSYGATIALEAAAGDPRVTRVVGYEPVLAPFGADALPALRAADNDRRVEIVNLDVSLFPPKRVAELRASPAWPVLARLAEPLADELTALNEFRPGDWSGVHAELILGELNQGGEPYGSAFDRVAERLPSARTVLLHHQGHLAHAEDPASLGRLIGELLARR